ncbi:hypothetical protein Tco_0547804 [Tanacetum coccineum]
MTMPPTSSLPLFIVCGVGGRLVTLDGSVGDVDDLIWLVRFAGDLHLLAWIGIDGCKLAEFAAMVVPRRRIKIPEPVDVGDHDQELIATSVEAQMCSNITRDLIRSLNIITNDVVKFSSWWSSDDLDFGAIRGTTNTTVFPKILTRSINKQTPLSQPTSVVRNTLGKEPVPQDPGRPISDEALREYYNRNYHQILPIITEKVHQEKAQQEKLKAVKSRLNFEETSRHSESRTLVRRRDLKERLGPRYVRGRFGSPEPRRGRSESPKKKGSERKTVFKRVSSKKIEELSESEGSAGGHWKSKLKRPKSSVEDDLSQPWVCEETYTFTPRIRYFDFPKTRMPSHIKTYDGSEDPEDHLKILLSAAKTERWAMPTYYDDVKKTFLENYLQQKKCIKDPVEIYNIKQRDGESTEEFVRRYKLECRDVKGAPECMKISGFMHGITNPELIKQLHDKIPKLVDEMMRVTTTFLRGEVAASNRERKKSFSSWKQQEAN